MNLNFEEEIKMKISNGNKILLVVVVLAVVAAGAVLAMNKGLFSADSAAGADKAVLEGNVQNITSELTANGYPDLVVQAGVPVRWNLHAAAGTINSCNNALVIPAYGIEVELREGDNIIEFTPDKTGTIPYSCWMGMINADVLVVDDLSSADTKALAAQKENDNANGTAGIPSCCGVQN
jgi:uncharacterized protein